LNATFLSISKNIITEVIKQKITTTLLMGESGSEKCGKFYSRTLQWWRSRNELGSHLSSL